MLISHFVAAVGHHISSLIAEVGTASVTHTLSVPRVPTSYERMLVSTERRCMPSHKYQMFRPFREPCLIDTPIDSGRVANDIISPGLLELRTLSCSAAPDLSETLLHCIPVPDQGSPWPKFSRQLPTRACVAHQLGSSPADTTPMLKVQKLDECVDAIYEPQCVALALTILCLTIRCNHLTVIFDRLSYERRCSCHLLRNSGPQCKPPNSASNEVFSRAPKL